MGHPFPSALVTRLQSGAHKQANIVKITLRDGTVLAMTDWDQNLSVNLDGLGAITYSRLLIQNLKAFAAQINTAIDDNELSVLVDSSSLTADKVRKGLFDAATVMIGLVDPDDLANPGKHRLYDVGQVKVEGASLRFELMGPEKRLEQNIGRTLTVNCPWNFGDAKCGISTSVSAWAATTAYTVGDEVKPTAANAAGWFRVTVAGTSAGSEPSWPGSGTIVDGTVTWKFFRARRLTGTVSGVTSKRQFAATGLNVASDHFGEGMLTWLTGSNAGQIRRIRSDNGSGAFVIHIPAFDTIVIGDTFTAIVGCHHRLAEDCIAKHANAEASSSQTLRFGGFPFLAPEDVTATADKGGEDDD